VRAHIHIHKYIRGVRDGHQHVKYHGNKHQTKKRFPRNFFFHGRRREKKKRSLDNEHWALISFSDICVPTCHCLCGHTLTFPPPRTLPYYPRTQHPPCPLSQATNIGGGLPLSIMGARRRNLRSARGSVSTAPCATCTMRRQDLTPGLIPSQHPYMQQHFTPTCSPPPTPLHPIAISVLAINSL